MKTTRLPPASQNAQLGNARLAGACRQGNHQMVGLIDGAGRGLDLRRRKVDLRSRTPLKQCDKQFAKPSRKSEPNAGV
jgi:hypothetical protein